MFRNRALAEAAVETLKVYAQPQRLMILSCLLEGERIVSDIDSATGIGQPALSQKLAELRRKNLVRTRRQGTQIFYALADEKVELCVRCMEAILGDGELPQVMQRTHAETTAPAPVGAAAFARVLKSTES
ncbi:MAG: helix-turn-helix domain-containing protein [Rhodospirillales bacterium]|nr:helix-turn-helix domain-containing protein [Rhodospirillales bacterium]